MKELLFHLRQLAVFAAIVAWVAWVISTGIVR